MRPVEISCVDASIEAELTANPEYPTRPPSPRQPVARRSSLRITTISNISATSFCPTPTPKSATSRSLPSSFSKPPPEVPSRWLWRCHLCGLSYALGTTRRCLNDGHYFCAGTTINKRTGKKKTHSPCGSTFDYVGWQEYGDWRRHEQDLRTKPTKRKATNPPSPPPKPFRIDPSKSKCQTPSSNPEKESPSPDIPSSATTIPAAQNCEHACNFPSECRWKATQSPSSPPPTNTTNQKSKKSTRSETSSAEPAIPPVVQQEANGKEFHLGKTSVRRQMSFSLPLSAYAWLVAPATATADDDDAGDGGPALVSVSPPDGGSDAKVGEGEGADEQLWLLPVLRYGLG